MTLSEKIVGRILGDRYSKNYEDDIVKCENCGSKKTVRHLAYIDGSDSYTCLKCGIDTVVKKVR
jgi:DNA-directed RNA polymerase subunit RPC12/RpoP